MSGDCRLCGGFDKARHTVPVALLVRVQCLWNTYLTIDKELSIETEDQESSQAERSKKFNTHMLVVKRKMSKYQEKSARIGHAPMQSVRQRKSKGCRSPG